LALEKDAIVRKLKQKSLSIEALYRELADSESKRSVIERSLEESGRISRETEEGAFARAQLIEAEADRTLTENRLRLNALEEEIYELNQELDYCKNMVEMHERREVEKAKSVNPAPVTISPATQPKMSDDLPLTSAASEVAASTSAVTPSTPVVPYHPVSEAERVASPESSGDRVPNNLVYLTEDGRKPAPKYHPPRDDSVYNMKLVVFVNARHFVTFGAKPGPVHAHSWQVELEVEIPQELGESMEFAKVSRAVTAALSAYENTILNQVHPFQIIQPTTENIAMYFFNRVEEVLVELKLELARLSLWETPARGIQVEHRNTELDQKIESAHAKEEELKAIAAIVEAAAREESNLGAEEGLVEEEEERVGPVVSLGPLRPSYTVKQYLMAAVIICLVALGSYHQILWPAVEQRYPWGSDSWGHLFKADNLYEEIQKGNFYPQFTEYWYNGVQPFRYWAPLPYYVLAGLRALTGDIFSAGNLYLFLCALFGALCWLLLSRRMGLWPSMMAGIIWLLWQDNVRVAFSEGNLPRVLATALLPLLFALFLRLSDQRRSYFTVIATVIVIQLCVLCHAMIAAVYCVCLALFALFLWVMQGTNARDFVGSIITLAVGLVSSGWWLLPSLTGGITGIDADAVKEIVQFIPAAISLNPWYRFTNIETFYWGVALIAALGITLASWKSRPPWARSAALVGLILVVITFPLVRALYITLPLSHLMWPLRFSSVGALAIIAAGFTINPSEQPRGWLKSPYVSGLLIVALFISLALDNVVSFRLLAHTGTKPFDIIQSADYIKRDPGWRVATIDLSQLGSAPSYAFSELYSLEQVFGWAWQGAVTSRNIMLLNTGLEKQYYPFLFCSCVDLGATDLVVKDDVITDVAAFGNAGQKAGYVRQNKFAGISVWRNISTPYMVEKKPDCLVIGKYAGTVAVQFPEVEMGVSPYIDSYSPDKLREYSQVILTGATWKSKKKAEDVVTAYASGGGKVFVELAGMPENVLAKQPEFLGVYGEAVTTHKEVDVIGQDSRYVLYPVMQKATEWKAYVPMGLDHVDMSFSYYGNQAPVLGYKLINGQKIWFVGYNIIYHSFCTGTTGSQELVARILSLKTTYYGDTLIPVDQYQVNRNGYRFSYHLDRTRELVVPVAGIPGMAVKLDGKPLASDNYENLVQLKLPAGQHLLELQLGPTPVYEWGKYLSLFSLILIVLLLWLQRSKGSETED